jgi:hypothetical protein
LTFAGARESVPWFVGFAALIAVSAGLDPALAAGAPEIPNTLIVVFFALNILGPSTTAYALLQYLPVLASEPSRNWPTSTARSNLSRRSLSGCCSTSSPHPSLRDSKRTSRRSPTPARA